MLKFSRVFINFSFYFNSRSWRILLLHYLVSHMRMKLDIEEKELGIDPPPSINIEKENGEGGGGNWFKLDHFFYLGSREKCWTIYSFNSGIVFRIFNYTSSTRFFSPLYSVKTS